MAGNGWRGKGDPLEAGVERWLIGAGIKYRRADDMKTRLDFFLPDHNVYIECKRFETPRTNDQLQRATDIIVVQGGASLRFLQSLIPASSSGRTPDFDSGNCGSNPRAGTSAP